MVVIQGSGAEWGRLLQGQTGAGTYRGRLGQALTGIDWGRLGQRAGTYRGGGSLLLP